MNLYQYNPYNEHCLFFYSRLSFLPDPKDGSLYALSDGREGIKKLPFTIPQLVTASPCKSNEGMLYTGRGNYSVFKEKFLSKSLDLQGFFMYERIFK